MNAFGMLLRLYRPIVLWFAGALVFFVGLADVVILQFTDMSFSLWMYIGGSAVKYWSGVVGIMLVATHLRQFVSAGVTRRHFLTGGLLFGVLAAVAAAVFITLGHGVEYALRGGADGVPASYPDWSAAVALRELGHILPSCLAFLIAGATAAAAFYRFGAAIGLALVTPAVLPIAVSEGLLGIGEKGEVLSRFLPYGVAFAVSLTVTAVGALALRRAVSDIAIRSAPVS
jgi:hypothetical protein